MNMDDSNDPQLKRDRPSPYGHPPPSGLHHMPPTEPAALHGYHPHPPPPGAGMRPPHWNPTPSPYEGGEHRPPHAEPSLHQQPPPHQYYGPPPTNREQNSYPPDSGYSRQGSASAPSRSPSNQQQPQYPPPPVNGAPPDHQYYQQQPPPPDYRGRPAYGPPEGQSNGAPPPNLHVTTNHEMMSGQPQSAPPLSYGPPHSAGPHPGTPGYWTPSYEVYAQRRKPVRAAQACDPCRQRKAKCDEGRPTCTHCKDNGLTCTYRDIPPQKSEKQVLAITDKLESLGDDVKTMMQQWKAQEEKINRILNMQEAQANQMKSIVSSMPEEQKPSRDDASRTTRPSHAPKQELTSQMLHQSAMSSAVGETPQEPKGDTPKDTTAAANLLSWPAIKKLIPSDQTTSYVMDTESERGLLRLFGCGEGEDRGDGHDGAPSPATSSSSGRFDEEVSNLNPSGVWGTGQFPPPSASSMGGGREHPGGLSPHGGLHLDTEIIDKYYQSYLDNMHKLHPFLDTRVLRKMVQTFIRKYSWDSRYNQRARSTIGKRKRENSDSPNSLDEYGTGPTPHRNQPRPVAQLAPIEHSVANAIILLILALGKICAHKDPLPAPVATSSIRTATPHSAVYSDLPISMAISASAPASPHASQINMNGGPVGSIPPGNPQGKNMDVIPGLAYFTKAADILGEMPGGVDVSHVQANLLAGLYMGQLARIVPSHWYIRNACTACQILIQSTAYREHRMSPARRNLINFAFWSCLQLESDILAEMEFPASGIVSREATMWSETPTELTLADPEGGHRHRVMEEHRHYLYQIQLRRTLNDSLKYLYNENRAHTKPPETVIRILGSNLESWRNLLNDWNWSDTDHESTDINVARMRGKYYGAKYIIHRPALYWALNLATPSTPMSRPSESPLGHGGESEFSSPAVSHSFNSQPPHNRRTNTMKPPPAKYPSQDPLESWVIEAARKCVNAAINSTTAFDKVPQRLIITNIFGTAHAQFGNMLVLSATFASSNPELNVLVEESLLRSLMTRTIKFLQRHENISPTLGADARILQHVASKLWPSNPPGSAASSFSSR